jgi:D-3-phosphoglycerate dehydrogenase
MKILANDGIDAAGKAILENAGFNVYTDKIPQDELEQKIKDFDVLIVRSATKVNEKVIRAGNLRLIARAGVGLDNIDLKVAGELGIPVVNTPNASSRSVAELVFAHAFSIARSLYLSNRIMPEKGKELFKDLKNTASSGFELTGKKIGIIGFGRIGHEVAKIAVGLGMEVLIYDYKSRTFELVIDLNQAYRKHNFILELKGMPLETVLSQSDIISIHTPGSEEVIGSNELAQMKKTAMLINCARGGVVNEKALNEAISTGMIGFAGIDVFESEPPVNDLMLTLQNTSLSPHIGASTLEAQLRVGIELAERIVTHLK